MSFDIFIIYKACIKYVLRDTWKRNIEKLCKLLRSLSSRKFTLSWTFEIQAIVQKY